MTNRQRSPEKYINSNRCAKKDDFLFVVLFKSHGLPIDGGSVWISISSPTNGGGKVDGLVGRCNPIVLLVSVDWSISTVV